MTLAFRNGQARPILQINTQALVCVRAPLSPILDASSHSQPTHRHPQWERRLEEGERLIVFATGAGATPAQTQELSYTRHPHDKHEAAGGARK